MQSRDPHRVHSAKDLDEASTVLATVGPGIDICEFCGGEARTSAVAVRRHLQAGRNFDLVTQADLGDPGVQRAAMKYLDENEVQVLVMAPSCRTLGPPSNVNYQTNHPTWCRHYEEDAPHIRFCGKAAQHQIEKGRHFAVENPYPTWLFHEMPWPTVCQDSRVCSVIVDQCMLGLKNADGQLVKKPTI